MNNQKDKYLEVSNTDKSDDQNEDFSLNPKEFLLLNDENKWRTKYFYCISAIIFFFLGYLICYLFQRKAPQKVVNNKITPRKINLKPPNKQFDIKFLEEIQRVFEEKNKVNINEIETKLNLSEKMQDNEVKSTVHIAFTLDPRFTLETMLTISSILALRNIIQLK